MARQITFENWHEFISSSFFICVKELEEKIQEDNNFFEQLNGIERNLSRYRPQKQKPFGDSRSYMPRPPRDPYAKRFTRKKSSKPGIKTKGIGYLRAQKPDQPQFREWACERQVRKRRKISRSKIRYKDSVSKIRKGDAHDICRGLINLDYNKESIIKVIKPTKDCKYECSPSYYISGRGKWELPADKKESLEKEFTEHNLKQDEIWNILPDWVKLCVRKLYHLIPAQPTQYGINTDIKATIFTWKSLPIELKRKLGGSELEDLYGFNYNDVCQQDFKFELDEKFITGGGRSWRGYR